MEAGNPQLADVVAASVRRLRVARNLSQKALASELRLVGLRWTRLTVAQFEARSGKTPRNVSLGEALALAKMLDVPLSDLLETDAETVVIEEGEWPAPALSATMHGEAGAIRIETPEWARSTRLDWSAVERAFESQRLWARRWDFATAPDSGAHFRLAAERVGEPERTAADRVRRALRMPVMPEDVVCAADRLWGRTITEERDRKLALDGRVGEASSQSLKALRGQVMRRVYADLAREIDEAAARAKRAHAREES